MGRTYHANHGNGLTATWSAEAISTDPPNICGIASASNP
jgi:hypothetical protein